MNVICVIVTYNRLQLLKECIAAVRQQSYPITRIIIIDNHSTDGTTEYLSDYAGNPQFQIVTMEKNVGGAGGFSEGVKQAALAHADWIWLMDDDTIPQPDALENMIPYTQVEKVGFICSEVVWIDGSSHMMNQAKLLSDQSMKSQILSPVGKSSENVELAEMASFVSLLINGDIPWKLGLPYKEFFIWCDDAEYTKRIASNGYYGLYVKNSIALHKTGENYVSSLHTVPASASWKIYYGVRNDSFLRRKKKGWVRFFFSQLNCFRTHAHRIKKRHLPKDEELKLLKANNRGLIDGFLFNPQIEYLQE